MTFGDYIAKAKRALASAQLLLDDGDTNGACNRAYYADRAGQTLNQVERIRLLADYTDKDVKPEDAAWAIEQARVMLETVENRLG